MATEKRQIKLDPMEWRDAMKDIAKPEADAKKKAPKSRPAAGAKRGKAEPAKKR